MTLKVPTEADSAFSIAGLYEQDNSREHHLHLACVYYALAIQLNNDATKTIPFRDKLNQLLDSSEISAEELTALGLTYYNASHGIKKDLKNAQTCFERACITGPDHECL